ncbi:MAG TPA: YcxB family protein, partial [Labilithrix sp.]|nr:YcxB family protein [Labilithrix sp.]
VGHIVSLAGGLAVISGLILGFGAMAMLVFENVYLLLREDGVLCHDNGKETTIAWSDLEAVTVDERAGVVVFHRKDEAPLRWFSGANAKELCRRIEDAKRKAVHGLFKSDPPAPMPRA